MFWDYETGTICILKRGEHIFFPLRETPEVPRASQCNFSASPFPAMEDTENKEEGQVEKNSDEPLAPYSNSNNIRLSVDS